MKEKANDTQIGGGHYKGQKVQHWDYAYSRGFDCYQYIITKWVERWRDKGGIEDLRKARHAIDKYIEVAEEEEAQRQGMKAGVPSFAPGTCAGCGSPDDDVHATKCPIGGRGEPTKEYVDQ